LRQAQLGCSHLVGSTAAPATRSGGEEPSLGSLDDQLALELGEGREDPEDQLAGSGRRVDGGAVPGEDPEPDAALRELVD
jgi:hypothetical protein